MTLRFSLIAYDLWKQLYLPRQGTSIPTIGELLHEFKNTNLTLEVVVVTVAAIIMIIIIIIIIDVKSL